MSILSRRSALNSVLLSALLVGGCASQKEPSGIADGVSAQRGPSVAAVRIDESDRLDEGTAPTPPDAATGQLSSGDSVTPSTNVAPAREGSPRANGGSTPIAAPTHTTPARTQPTPATTPAGTGADAFWTAFQRAIRSGDRAAIEAGVGETVRVNDESFARSSEDVQGFIDSLVDNDAVRDATLAVQRLEHDSGFSVFEARVAYVFNGQRHEVPLAGRIEQVRPGDWRLTEVTVGL